MPKYDLAVVGAGLGGLAAAARLSKKNKKVIVLAPSGDVGGATALLYENGFRFTTSPAFSFGFEPGGALKQLCSELGIPNIATVLSPCYQVALPDRRITVYAGTDKTLEELAREFPGDIETVTTFYRDLKKMSLQSAKGGLSAYLARRRSAASFMQRYRFSRELTVFFDLQSRHFFGLPVEDISLSALTSLVTTVPLYMQNGFKPFIDQIKNSLLQNGVEVRFAEPAPELSYKRKRVVGLMTTRGMVEAKVFLFNIEQQPHASALFLGIHDEVVPAGMAQEVICLPNYARPHDFFVLSLSPRENESHAPRGMRSLTAMFTVPDNSLEQGPLIERIGRIIPFLKEYTVFSDAYSRAPRHYIFPDDMKFKRSNRSSLLSKASAGKLYVIPDDPWMPLQAVSAALQLADKLS